MMLSLEQWHQRYLQQSHWTQALRTYLYQKCDLPHANRILDVGCGTGVLEVELSRYPAVNTIGLDIEYSTLRFAKDNVSTARYLAGDGLALPFSAGLFDVTLCHFLLLWIQRAREAVQEMVRVTRPGGYVIALAEPDYGGRIDYPDSLAQLGTWQTQALQKQGANPYIGRQVSGIFTRAGLVKVEVGILGAQWTSQAEQDDDFSLEWQVLEADLGDNPEFLQQADKLKELERQVRLSRQRVLFVPVFYACGVRA